MPVDALPVPWPDALPGTVICRREFRDVLGRPMRGQVTLTGTRTGSVVVAAPVVVDLHGGVLDVALPPDTYTLTAALRTVDGARALVTDTVVLENRAGHQGAPQ